MMYGEFLEISGKTEKYISYREYTDCIEPIYMESNCTTKYEFISLLNETFEKLVYPAVEKAFKSMTTDAKYDYIMGGNNNNVQEVAERIDKEARQIAYEYLKLISKI